MNMDKSDSMYFVPNRSMSRNNTYPIRVYLCSSVFNASCSNHSLPRIARITAFDADERR